MEFGLNLILIDFLYFFQNRLSQSTPPHLLLFFFYVKKEPKNHLGLGTLQVVSPPLKTPPPQLLTFEKSKQK